MDLIIKPTERCNFACTFCSSSNIAYSKKDELDLDKIYQFLRRFPNTNTIIVNGGDPLMMCPSYYWKIIKFLDKNKMPANISLTTNLWDFWKRPDKWTELFKHDRIGVTTSFHYGDSRKITNTRVFTETDFIAISDLFLEKIGYRPDFISVITNENLDKAIDNVRLAKHLEVECKLNYAMASGREGKPFPVGKIYKTYVEIAKLGLGPWEFNTRQMSKRLKGGCTICPQNRSCDSGIRNLQPTGYHSCGAIGDDDIEDDGKYRIDFDKEVVQNGDIQTPLRDDVEIHYLKEECLTCPAFDICNGCYKTIKDLKKHNMVEENCGHMKEAVQYIIDMPKIDEAKTISIGFDGERSK